MHVYTVRKLGPNTDKELQAYIALLEEMGIDLVNIPRSLTPEAASFWLFVWKSKSQAESFARELGTRLHDSSWFVHEFELPQEESKPAIASSENIEDESWYQAAKRAQASWAKENEF